MIKFLTVQALFFEEKVLTMLALAASNAPPTLTGGIGYAGYILSLVYI